MMLSKTSRAIFLLALTSAFLGSSGCAGLLFAGGASAVVAANDRRTAGAQVDDQAIELKASRAVGADADLHGQSHINLTSFNGVLLITGEARTNDLREKVVAVARTVPGIRRIVNDVRVAELSPTSARTNDTWITSKVKSKLLTVDGLDSLQVKVVTENKVVYLLGLVTQKEADLAANSITGVTGIDRIVKLFEYTDDASRVQSP
jgi:osmotically-inducible protein OsmY